MLPAERMGDALKAFRAEFPTVSLRLYIEALGAVRQTVLEGRAMIGICGALDEAVAGIERIDVGSIEWVPVAAPDHPLTLAGRNAPGAGRSHLQLVLRDRSPLTQAQDFGVIGTQNWRLADLSSKHVLLRDGPILLASAGEPGQAVKHRVEQGAKARALAEVGENGVGLLLENSMTDFLGSTV
jgi:DNA-binding transcriptional LysR family regulator